MLGANIWLSKKGGQISLLIHSAVEKFDTIASISFSSVHGSVRLLQDYFSACVLIWKQGYSNTG